MAAELIFRDADPSEDDEVARIIYNALLRAWNFNWFQCLTAPVDTIRREPRSPLTLQQSRGLAFYRAWISLNRAHKGDVIVACAPDLANESSSPTLAAVVLLLPPHARPSWSEPVLAWRTGYLPAMFNSYGARGMWRACWTFETTIEGMIARGLKDLGIAQGKQEELLFCQCCARNPEWEGPKGPARRLFDWGIRRYWKNVAQIPVWLDVSTDEGFRVYDEMGFKLVAECTVDAGTDGMGIKLRKDATSEEKAEALKVTRLRVMVRTPELG